ncbi:MAG: hypothetical protein QOE70_3111 [Chthoniobacter sp.]|nr:hypothetical protein [Chthoniobacter sp.]
MQQPVEIARSRFAFTIVEVLVAVCAIALLGTGAVAGLLNMNRLATQNRLATGAQTIAQSEIDRILGVPFSRQGSAPLELNAGTTVQPSVPIYRDPVSGNLVVSGTVATTITDISRVIRPDQPPAKLLHAEVVVKYLQEGKPRSVALTTVRSPD